MLKGSSDASSAPSVTVILMSAYVPRSAAEGVPWRRPVIGSKSAQGGGFVTLKCRMSPSSSEASGWNAYGVSCRTTTCGVPLMVGGVLLTTGEPGGVPGAGSLGVSGGSWTEPPDEGGGVPGDGLPVAGGGLTAPRSGPGPSSPPQAARRNVVLSTRESLAL